MKDLIFDEFQNSVDECLLRHKSILDIMSKLQESEARVNRALIKSVTSCGCLKVEAERQHIPHNIDNLDLEDLDHCFDTHLKGNICNSCREILEKELGNHFFYIASVCNSLDLNLYDIFLKEYKNINALGKYTLK